MVALLILKDMAKLIVKIPIVICLWIALLTVSVVHGLYQIAHIVYWLIMIIGMVACIGEQYWYGAAGLIIIAVIFAAISGCFDAIRGVLHGLIDVAREA